MSEVIRKNEMTLYVGEPQIINITVTNSEGNILPLTSDGVNGVRLRVKKNKASNTGIILLDKSGVDLSADGTATFNLQSGDTEGWKPGVYVYEVVVDLDDGVYVAEVNDFLVRRRLK